MKKFIAIAAICFATIATSPANANMLNPHAIAAAAPTANADTVVHKTGRRGRRGRIGAGIALGIIGAAVASHHYSRYGYREHRISRHERRCRRWRRWCRDGEGRACWKYDNRC